MSQYDLDDLPTAYAWFEDGDPLVVDDQFLWNTPDDAYSFMKEYMKEEGVTDLSRYELYETKVSGKKDGEEFMGFGDTQ